MVQLHTTDLSFSHGADRLIENVSISAGPGDRVGLVGPNGCGKSTLLALIAGELKPEKGAIGTTPSTATVGLMTQSRMSNPGEDIKTLITRQTGVADAQRALDESLPGLTEGSVKANDAYDAAFQRWMQLGGADLEQRTLEVLSKVTDVDPAVFLGRIVESLSGGEKAKVWLSVLELSQFDILLLDEPTNDLDLAGLERLEEVVLAHQGPLVLVSHDRTFLDRIVTEVIEFDPDPRKSKLSSVSRFGGGWSAYLDERQVRRAQAFDEYQSYTSERDRLEARAKTTRSWSAKGVARERRPPDNDRAARGARIEASEQLASKARQMDRAIDRLEHVDRPWEPWQLQFEIGEIERSGDLVFQLENAVVGQGTFEIGPINLEVLSGDRILIQGPNGAGKTTMLRALLGELPLRSGSHHIGRSVVLGALDQSRRRLDVATDLLRAFMDDTATDKSTARSVLAKFGLTTRHISRPSIELSPGEQTRAVLAAFATTGVNTVVLDEPTNHLDLEAIEQLEQALSKFAGTLLVISHDRAFVEGLNVTHRYELDGGLLP